MQKNLDNLKIISEIKENGYAVIENFYDKKDLDFLKDSFVQCLNYIHKSDEKDLTKKYYEIKKFNPKLKSNFYDLMPRNLNMLKMIHCEHPTIYRYLCHEHESLVFQKIVLPF